MYNKNITRYLVSDAMKLYLHGNELCRLIANPDGTIGQLVVQIIDLVTGGEEGQRLIDQPSAFSDWSFMFWSDSDPVHYLTSLSLAQITYLKNVTLGSYVVRTVSGIKSSHYKYINADRVYFYSTLLEWHSLIELEQYNIKIIKYQQLYKRTNIQKYNFLVQSVTKQLANILERVIQPSQENIITIPSNDHDQSFVSNLIIPSDLESRLKTRSDNRSKISFEVNIYDLSRLNVISTVESAPAQIVDQDTKVSLQVPVEIDQNQLIPNKMSDHTKGDLSETTTVESDSDLPQDRSNSQVNKIDFSGKMGIVRRRFNQANNQDVSNNTVTMSAPVTRPGLRRGRHPIVTAPVQQAKHPSQLQHPQVVPARSVPKQTKPIPSHTFRRRGRRPMSKLSVSASTSVSYNQAPTKPHMKPAPPDQDDEVSAFSLTADVPQLTVNPNNLTVEMKKVEAPNDQVKYPTAKGIPLVNMTEQTTTAQPTFRRRRGFNIRQTGATVTIPSATVVSQAKLHTPPVSPVMLAANIPKFEAPKDVVQQAKVSSTQSDNYTQVDLQRRMAELDARSQRLRQKDTQLNHWQDRLNTESKKIQTMQQSSDQTMQIHLEQLQAQYQQQTKALQLAQQNAQQADQKLQEYQLRLDQSKQQISQAQMRAQQAKQQVQLQAQKSHSTLQQNQNQVQKATLDAQQAQQQLQQAKQQLQKAQQQAQQAQQQAQQAQQQAQQQVKQAQALLQTCPNDMKKFQAAQDQIAHLQEQLEMQTRRLEDQSRQLSQIRQANSSQSMLDTSVKVSANTGNQVKDQTNKDTKKSSSVMGGLVTGIKKRLPGKNNNVRDQNKTKQSNVSQVSTGITLIGTQALVDHNKQSTATQSLSLAQGNVNQYDLGAAPQNVSDSAHGIQESISGAAHTIQESVSGAAHTIQESVSGAAHDIQESVSDTAHSIQASVGDAAHGIQTGINKIQSSATSAAQNNYNVVVSLNQPSNIITPTQGSDAPVTVSIDTQKKNQKKAQKKAEEEAKKVSYQQNQPQVDLFSPEIVPEFADEADFMEWVNGANQAAAAQTEPRKQQESMSLEQVISAEEQRKDRALEKIMRQARHGLSFNIFGGSPDDPDAEGKKDDVQDRERARLMLEVKREENRTNHAREKQAHAEKKEQERQRKQQQKLKKEREKQEKERLKVETKLSKNK